MGPSLVFCHTEMGTTGRGLQWSVCYGRIGGLGKGRSLCGNDNAGFAVGASDAGLASSATRKEAQAWRQRLRLAQEALTLLRGLSVQPQVRAMVLEDHVSSAASIRLCLATAGASPLGTKCRPSSRLRARRPLYCNKVLVVVAKSCSSYQKKRMPFVGPSDCTGYIPHHSTV